MKSPTQTTLCCALLLVASSGCLGAGADAKTSALFRPNEWKTVSLERLDTLRGGFETGAGLTVSFGLIRTVSINGDVVNRTSFSLPDVSKISPEQARLASAALTSASVVQNGAGNLVGSNLSAQLSGGTLIQNTLNDQTIQTLTVINAGVNSLGLFKSSTIQSAMKDALFGSFGTR